jgi:hypothetical protein
MRSRSFALSVGFVVIAVALAAAMQVYSQNVGTVRGTVTSVEGEPLPGVLVQVTGEIVRDERISTSGAGGVWLIPGLPPGTVTATLEGLETETVGGVRVSISGVAAVNLTMRPDSVEEAITVTSEAPLLDVTTSSLSVSFSEDLIDAKPSTTRQFQEPRGTPPRPRTRRQPVLPRGRRLLEGLAARTIPRR